MGKIVKVKVTAWVGATFEALVDGEAKTYHSSTAEIVGAALVAFFADAEVELIPYESTDVVQRVYAFKVRLPDPHAPPHSPLPPLTSGTWAVGRMATQTNPQSGNHLELFLFQDDPKMEKPVNAYYPLFQQAFLAAAHNASRFDVDFEGETNILSIRFKRRQRPEGEKRS